MVLLFVHIPKTAGTSIIESMNTKIRRIRFVGHNLILEKSSDRIDRNQMSVWSKFGNTLYRYRSFAVVRHPYTRFLSAYCYLSDKKRRGIDQEAGAIIRSYPNINAFIKNLPHHMERIVHFLPQHVFICKDDTIIINHVLRFEDLPGCLSIIHPHIPLCHVNRSDWGQYNLRLTRESIGILQQCYQKDFDILGYDRNDFSSITIQ